MIWGCSRVHTEEENVQFMTIFFIFNIVPFQPNTLNYEYYNAFFMSSVYYNFTNSPK